jgi:acyl-CoA synthetase (AMP-forming)/AMP-acid ligase II
VLIELVRAAAARAPAHPAVITPRATTTYGALLDRAQGLAAALVGADLARFGCRVADPADLIALLVGASAIGAEPCVYPATLDGDAVNELSARLEHPTVVTDATLAGWADADAPSPSPAGSSAPLLVLTTGTTGQPKAARHDWGRLAGGVRHRDPDPDRRWLLAYNLNQFAGVQVLLHALASGATIVVPASIQPRDAVEAMESHRVTHASATPTFWRFVVGTLDAATADRIPLQQITLGGEAVPGPVLDQLAELWPRARDSQVFASTEFGSGVSVTDRRSGLPLSVLERGPDADVQYRIVDDQLQARSNVGMLGYLGADEVGDGWMPTGDLVEVVDDRICFVGRVGDTINVGGVKVHPLPIEEAVAKVPGVKMAKAYGRSNPVSGNIVALDVVLADGAEREAVEDAIRAACAPLPPAAQPRRIRFVDEIEVRGGKVVRQGGQPDAR